MIAIRASQTRLRFREESGVWVCERTPGSLASQPSRTTKEAKVDVDVTASSADHPAQAACYSSTNVHGHGQTAQHARRRLNSVLFFRHRNRPKAFPNRASATLYPICLASQQYAQGTSRRYWRRACSRKEELLDHESCAMVTLTFLERARWRAFARESGWRLGPASPQRGWCSGGARQ